jgi:hypothetical protein
MKRDTTAIVKQLGYVIAGIACLFALVHFAPIISHGG